MSRNPEQAPNRESELAAAIRAEGRHPPDDFKRGAVNIPQPHTFLEQNFEVEKEAQGKVLNEERVKNEKEEDEKEVIPDDQARHEEESTPEDMAQYQARINKKRV